MFWHIFTKFSKLWEMNDIFKLEHLDGQTYVDTWKRSMMRWGDDRNVEFSWLSRDVAWFSLAHTRTLEWTDSNSYYRYQFYFRAELCDRVEVRLCLY